jgi:hypothetical protein
VDSLFLLVIDCCARSAHAVFDFLIQDAYCYDLERYSYKIYKKAKAQAMTRAVAAMATIVAAPEFSLEFGST